MKELKTKNIDFEKELHISKINQILRACQSEVSLVLLEQLQIALQRGELQTQDLTKNMERL